MFLVGPPGYGESMTASVSKLSRGSPVFHAMLEVKGPEKDL